MNNECLASLITVSLKVTINKVKTRYRSRLFSSDIRMFLFFPSRSFTVQFIHYKYFCFTINIQRAMTSFYIFFAFFVSGRQSKGVIVTLAKELPF